MSTTITYKGNALTTVNNETKKLRTAGTWLEDDIFVTDESGSEWDYEWDYTDGLLTSNGWTVVGTPTGTETMGENGVVLTGPIELRSPVNVMNSGVMEIDFISPQQTTGCTIYAGISNGTSGAKFSIDRQYWRICDKVMSSCYNMHVLLSQNPGNTLHTVRLELGETSSDYYVDGVLQADDFSNESVVDCTYNMVGYYLDGLSATISGIRYKIGGSDWGSALIVDTPDSHGGTVREITTSNIVTLQAQKQVTLASSPQTITPDTGYDGFASVVVSANMGISWDDIANGSQPSGLITVNSQTVKGTQFTCNPNQNWMLYAPNCTTTDGSAIRAAVKCTHAAFPMLANMNSGYFAYQSAQLQVIDMGVVAQILNQSFNMCTALSTIIMRKSDGITTLNSTNNFASTPFKSGGTGGTIYIPEVLYNHLGDGTEYDYKSATNWSTCDGYGTITWAKIEGSQYENTAWILQV